jgi:hypothetical protein
MRADKKDTYVLKAIARKPFTMHEECQCNIKNALKMRKTPVIYHVDFFTEIDDFRQGAASFIRAKKSLPDRGSGRKWMILNMK